MYTLTRSLTPALAFQSSRGQHTEVRADGVVLRAAYAATTVCCGPVPEGEGEGAGAAVGSGLSKHRRPGPLKTLFRLALNSNSSGQKTETGKAEQSSYTKQTFNPFPPETSSINNTSQAKDTIAPQPKDPGHLLKGLYRAFKIGNFQGFAALPILTCMGQIGRRRIIQRASTFKTKTHRIAIRRPQHLRLAPVVLSLLRHLLCLPLSRGKR